MSEQKAIGSEKVNVFYGVEVPVLDVTLQKINERVDELNKYLDLTFLLKAHSPIARVIRTTQEQDRRNKEIFRAYRRGYDSLVQPPMAVCLVLFAPLPPQDHYSEMEMSILTEYKKCVLEGIEERWEKVYDTPIRTMFFDFLGSEGKRGEYALKVDMNNYLRTELVKVPVF